MRLTVIVPNYNHARFLPLSLAALLGQSRAADELIVIDDASTDDSVAVITRLLAGTAHARLERNPANLGVVRSMNRGLEMARGDVVFFAAADDLVYPALFATGMALLESHPQAALFSARTDLIDADGRFLGRMATAMPCAGPGYVDPVAVARALMRDDSWMVGNTTLYRRAALLDAGGFAVELNALTDGYVSMLLACSHGACYAPDFLAAWRRMPGGVATSQMARLDQAQRLIDVVERKMSAAGSPFPRGYPRRWRAREIFGTRRFNLIEATRRGRSAGGLPRLIALAHAATLSAWLLLRWRPWDIPTILARRLRYIRARPARIDRSETAN